MTLPSGRTGRPPLTEERKAEIRLEIARAAVDLFVAQGVAATTGEQIARAAGISARTLWRYFPTKESCVRPLFSAGIEAIAARLRAWPPGRPLREAFEDGLPAHHRLTGGTDHATVGQLLRLARGEPGLRGVWLQSYDEAEPAFARALAERAALPPGSLRPAIQAAMLNAALRASVEHCAWHAAPDAPGRAPDPGHPGAGDPDTPDVPHPDTPEPAAADARLAATVRAALAIAAEGLA